MAVVHCRAVLQLAAKVLACTHALVCSETSSAVPKSHHVQCQHAVRDHVTKVNSKSFGISTAGLQIVKQVQRNRRSRATMRCLQSKSMSESQSPKLANFWHHAMGYSLRLFAQVAAAYRLSKLPLIAQKAC